MVRTKEQGRDDLRVKMRGGEGQCTVTHLIEPSDMEGKCKLCGIITIEPGNSIGLHVHDPDAEIFYVLEGEAYMTDNGKEVILREGDTMYTPAGHSHEVINKTDKTVKLFAVVVE